MIPFNMPYIPDHIEKKFTELLYNRKFCGDGIYTKKCAVWFEEKLDTRKTLLTTSCTHALEMAAILIDIRPDDEVIMPSYTFVSTANAFILRGAKIVFVDIRPDTMNIDETKIEQAISSRTKAIIPVHYAGVACEMDTIMALANKYNLFVIEDAAQGMMSTYKGRALGTIGHLGAYSFHETKNYHSGEGGLLIINDNKFTQRAEIIREKGTNRSCFLRGEVDKYTWVDFGSSYLPSEFNAWFLFNQLDSVEVINQKRLLLWNTYSSQLSRLASDGYIELPVIPNGCEHNAHMFYIKVLNVELRDSLIGYLKNEGISSVFHYVPLHSSPFGRDNAVFNGVDKFTTLESNRLLRLPMYYDLSIEDVMYVCNKLNIYFDRLQSL